MKIQTGNIYSQVPDGLPDELFEDIVATDEVKIERIVSLAHASPPGFWYDQGRDEWVILLRGSAGLLFQGPDETVVLKPGDWLNIPAHRKHRVEWTDSDEKTIWLAVHY
jgi:cupin 2 domain-containing protein